MEKRGSNTTKNDTQYTNITKIHDQILRMLYQNKKLSFNELLEFDNPVSICYRKLKVLETDVFKVKNNLAPEMMKKFLKFKKLVMYTSLPRQDILKEKT